MKIHPFAFENNKSGACGMKAGDRIVYVIDGRHGVADEFLQDGDAFVTWDDGTFGTVKWNNLYPEPVDYKDISMPRKWTYYDDVGMFHQKFGLPYYGDGDAPRLLDQKTFDFRLGFLHEELDEFKCACDDKNLHDAVDALADIVYVALGTAHLMGLPFEKIWDEVQRANMTKALPDDNSFKLVRPPGFKPPDHTKALEE